MKPTVEAATIKKMVDNEIAENQKWVDAFKKKHGRLPTRTKFFEHRKEQFERGDTLVEPKAFMKIMEDLGVEWT